MTLKTESVSFTEAIGPADILTIDWRDKKNQPGQRPEDIEVHIHTEHTFQTVEGIGGSFSEIGWNALASLGEDERNKVVRKLFGPTPDCAFSFCRMPIGASDFATDAYSLNDTVGDFTMEHFTVERDEKGLIPYIKAAQAENAELKIHASPWSPPGWMKTSGKMDGGDGLLIDEDRIYRAYALYFRRFIEEYEARGIPVDRVMVQNEPDANSSFPNCHMEPETLIKFTLDYLAPEFISARLKTKIWGGTFRGITGLQSHRCMANALYRETVSGVGFQYAFAGDILELTQLYPGTPVMHTESVCWRGENSERQAAALFHDFVDHMKAGCTIYTYWNMILDENSSSAWAWSQNSLVQIDRNSGEVTYHPDFQVMNLLGRHLKPKARRVESFCFAARSIAFQNPDGEVVIFLLNPGDEREAVFKVDGTIIRRQVPARSVVAATFGG